MQIDKVPSATTDVRVIDNDQFSLVCRLRRLGAQ
jgi:hypothetical protein